MSESAVNYIEKGVGLHDAVAASGHYLYEVDGVWIGGGPMGHAYVQAIIDTYQEPVHDRVISVPQFFLLLQPDEWSAFLSSDNVVIRYFVYVLSDVRLPVVDLGDPVVAGGLAAAAQLGILAAGRAERILSGLRPA